jgi:hypothetical protein
MGDEWMIEKGNNIGIVELYSGNVRKRERRRNQGGDILLT